MTDPWKQLPKASSYFPYPHVHYSIRDRNFVTFPVCEGQYGLSMDSHDQPTIRNHSDSAPTVQVPEK